MYNLKFKKINENSYTVEVPDGMLREIYTMIDVLSLNDTASYTPIVNKSLRDVILARYISSHFYKEVNIVPIIGFVVIEAKCDNETVLISAGKSEIDNSGVKSMSWVMYK